jgi:hypothetical protein
MVIVEHGTVQPPTVTSRTSSVMLRMTPSPCKEKASLSACFSPWEKLSRDATDEGLMVIIKAPHRFSLLLQPPEPHPPCSAGTFS